MLDPVFTLTVTEKALAYTAVLSALNIPARPATKRDRGLSAKYWQMLHLDADEALVALDLSDDLNSYLLDQHVYVFRVSPKQISKASGWPMTTTHRALDLMGAEHRGSFWSNSEPGQTSTKVIFPAEIFLE